MFARMVLFLDMIRLKGCMSRINKSVRRLRTRYLLFKILKLK